MRTRTIGRYKLKPHAAMELRAYGVHITHRDTGTQWLLEADVDSMAACEAAIDRLTIPDIEQMTASIKPLQFPEE